LGRSTFRKMIDENEDPQAAATCEQLNINGQTLSDHLGSSSLSAQTQSWEPVLEKAIKAIVSIKANRVRSFDTAKAGESY
jgi:hypothetical protein